MKTAQPASLPPGVFGSGGIRRSTRASTEAASSAVKNSQPPGRTGIGGTPAEGCHGNLPTRMRARAGTSDSRNEAMLPSRTPRRRIDIGLLPELPALLKRARELGRPANVAVGESLRRPHSIPD